MRIYLLLLALSGIACGEEGQSDGKPLVVPKSGGYQATLTSYLGNSCDSSIVQPAGTFDASVSIGDLDDKGQIALAGSRIWQFGSVQLSPGDQGDSLERLSWRGFAQTELFLYGCRLQISVRAQYFPIDETSGGLHMEQRFALSRGSCALPLPCQNTAIWRLRHH